MKYENLIKLDENLMIKNDVSYNSLRKNVEHGTGIISENIHMLAELEV